MSRIERIKPIHTAIAAPGSGKTEALLSKLPSLTSSGKRLVLALPTLVLSDEIIQRASSKGITCRPIDHRDGELVVRSLEKALEEKVDNFIVCTQDSIRRIRPSLLHNWTLVLDELPKVVDYPDYPVKPSEMPRILQFTVERDGKLQIIDGLEEQVREQVSTNRADARGMDCSTLGSSAAHIFRLLLSDVEVFIDQPTSDGTRHIRAVEEYTDWWDIFSSAIESHVLAASIKNSEFEVFAQVHGFRFVDSEYTPEWQPVSNLVTICPVVPKDQKFSKKTMIAQHEDKRLIDIVLATIMEHVNSTPLLLANTWARFSSTRGVVYIPKDCRGLNSYANATEVIVLFGGNPSPSERLGLVYLKEKYGRDFEEAFITNRLLEPTLQSVTRTAVRSRDNVKKTKLYVQDYRVVDYLLSTYFPDATVDWSLAYAIPIKRDGRRLDEQTEEEVKRLISLETSALEIHRQTGVSRQKIQKMKQAYKAA
ncbi:hypothetical protein DKY63_28415 [Pseudomonas putida]|uniref:DEAD/DEAH box helicase n=1 Tax=Pseudomonas putida TaxID=303 RepID=A0A2Z4RUU2_PSEPU|nr:hypothetical protein [Pseudomonas putida]AWY43634.1 hypothetical protein DKY63_28415 [Pseudomonas putida]